jgi:hypothetical protein
LTLLNVIDLNFNGIRISLEDETENFTNFQEELKKRIDKANLPKGKTSVSTKTLLTTPKSIFSSLKPENMVKADEIKIDKITVELEVPIKENKCLTINLSASLYKPENFEGISSSEESQARGLQNSLFDINLPTIVASSLFGILLTLYIVLLVSFFRLKVKRKLCKCEKAVLIENRKSIGCCRQNAVKFTKGCGKKCGKVQLDDKQEVKENHFYENHSVTKFDESQPKVHAKKDPDYENLKIDRNKLRVTYTTVEIIQPSGSVPGEFYKFTSSFKF